MTEQDFIDAINSDAATDPERLDRYQELIYADWLDEQGDPRGEAWRRLIEAGKRPAGDVLYLSPTSGHVRTFYGLQWFPENAYDESSNSVWMDYVPHSVLSADIWGLLTAVRFDDGFFAAMNAAAIAWVRHHVDERFSVEA